MLPEFLEKYIGLPFEKYNCWQLMCLVYNNEFNIQLPTFEDEYSHAYDAENIKWIYIREFNRFVLIEKPEQYCFIALRMNGQPWHCGMIVDDKHMLHTSKRCDAVIERFKSKIWEPRILGFYKYEK